MEVRPWLQCYLEAFNHLSGARGLGFAGPLPIPLSEIESYCRLFDWHDPEEVAELVEIVRAMDAAYLEATARRNEIRNPAQEGESEKRARPPRPGRHRSTE